MIAITSDIDWAPEEIIQDTLDIFMHYKVKCTLFCTHDSSVVQKCDRDLFEIAIHPNFNSNLFENIGSSPLKKIENLLKLFPEARGVRSHSLTTSPVLSDLFCETGLKYESNYLIPYSKKIEIFKLWNGLVNIPINWEDNIHFYYGYKFNDLKIDLNKSLINVLNFHPIHIFLNTDKNETYEKAKVHYKNPKKLINFVNKDYLGTRDILVKTLSQIKKHNLNNYHLSEFANYYNL